MKHFFFVCKFLSFGSMIKGSTGSLEPSNNNNNNNNKFIYIIVIYKLLN